MAKTTELVMDLDTTHSQSPWHINMTTSIPARPFALGIKSYKESKILDHLTAEQGSNTLVSSLET